MQNSEHFLLKNIQNSGSIVALGGTLTTELVLSFYIQGAFPWYDSDTSPILWHNPDPRFVLFPENLHISRKLSSFLKKSSSWVLKLDHAFEELISLCAKHKRKDQIGTWITPNMQKIYIELHKQGFAHSCEVYKESLLIGGFYGICLGKIFFGESMVSLESQVSKYALTKFIQYFRNHGLKLIDCQQQTQHLLNLGASHISREQFVSTIKRWIFPNTWKGNWGKIFCDFY